VHLVPGCPAHVLLPLLVLFYNIFEQINNQSVNQKDINADGACAHDCPTTETHRKNANTSARLRKVKRAYSRKLQHLETVQCETVLYK